MSYLLETLTRKQEVDKHIRDTLDKVLVLRFGRATDIVCMQLDEIVIFSGTKEEHLKHLDICLKKLLR